MKKCSGLLLIVAAAGFLLAMMLLTAFSERTRFSYYENRTLAVCPVPNGEGLRSGAFFDEFETFLTDNAALRESLVKAQTAADLELLHRPVVNDVIVGRQGLHAFNTWAEIDREETAENAERMGDGIALLRDTVERYGGTYCYMAVPCQYAFYADDIPGYLNNCADKTAAELPALRDALTRRGVSFLDAGEIFEAEGDAARFTSAVDNHYRMEGAYEATQALLEHINESAGLQLALPETLSFRELPNHYIGAFDRKLFDLWDCSEKLSYAELSESVPFTREDDGKPVDPKVYAMPATEWENVFYNFYMGGDKGETVLRTQRPELPSILIYGDSFTNPMECLLYPVFNELRSLDQRIYKEMPLVDYVERYQPDIVVCVRDYQAILYEKGNGVFPTEVSGSY